MPDGDAVVADHDLLDDQPDDALAGEHVHGLGLGMQTFEEFIQGVGEPQTSTLISQLAIQRRQLRLQPHLALTQRGHAPSQFVQVEQFLLVGSEQPLGTPLNLKQLARRSVLMLLGRMRRARRFQAPGQFGLDQVWVLEQSCDLAPDGVLKQILADRRCTASRLSLVTPGVRPQATVVVDLSRAAARGCAYRA